MKRAGRPDLPLVRKGMPITVLHNGGAHAARVKLVFKTRAFEYRTEEKLPCDVHWTFGMAFNQRATDDDFRAYGVGRLRRRDHYTLWVKDWSGQHVDAFKAQCMLLR